MSQREARLSREIMTELRGLGAWCMKIHGGPTMTAGAPDIIGVWAGRFFGVETKLDTGVSARQAYVHRRIRQAGGVVVVAHSVREAVTLLHEGLCVPVPPGKDPAGVTTATRPR
jgi:Holliday junction resolvase